MAFVDLVINENFHFTVLIYSFQTYDLKLASVPYFRSKNYSYLSSQFLPDKYE